MVGPADTDKFDELDGIGFVNLGHQYALAARDLQEGNNSYGRALKHVNPVGFLYCHAMELCLKGLILIGQRSEDPKIFGHNLEELYDTLEGCQVAGPILRQVEKNVRARCKADLRGIRDGLRSKWPGFSESEIDALLELPSNSQIGKALPKLRSQVV